MRSGGLTKYACSLMSTQAQLGQCVSAIWPGNRFPFSKKMSIRPMMAQGDICCFEIKNALPLPLLYGIKTPNLFQTSEKLGFSSFNRFFSENKFDVLHVHSLMGMPLSFLLAAKKNGVKIVYTSHDYFGLCPRVNFIDSQGNVCEDASPESCLHCNKNAKSIWYLWVRNSCLLLILKKLFKR